eukprot:6902382-Prymnesium_polylepis.2
MPPSLKSVWRTRSASPGRRSQARPPRAHSRWSSSSLRPSGPDIDPRVADDEFLVVHAGIVGPARARGRRLVPAGHPELPHLQRTRARLVARRLAGGQAVGQASHRRQLRFRRVSPEADEYPHVHGLGVRHGEGGVNQRRPVHRARAVASGEAGCGQEIHDAHRQAVLSRTDRVQQRINVGSAPGCHRAARRDGDKRLSTRATDLLLSVHVRERRERCARH